MTSNKELTIILPCAGEGKRLDLDYPKELYEISPGVRLVDFSLNHIKVYVDSKKDEPYTPKIRVAVVIRAGKIEVADYISQQLPGVRISPILFNDAYSEWPGSVFSASNYFADNNLVLLPDSCLKLSGGDPRGDSIYFNNYGDTLIDLALKMLNDYKVIFGYIKTDDPNQLSQLGAMSVETGVVTQFQDKPVDTFNLYNSFWACYGFRKEYGKALYNYLIQSVKHQPLPLLTQSFNPVGAFECHSYQDIGTWDGINRFKRQCGKYL
jgi:hypothetical protein